MKITGSGAVTEQQFDAEFDVAVEHSVKVNVHEIPSKLKQICEIIENKDLDWNIYMMSIKNLRPLIVADTHSSHTLAMIEQLSTKLITFATDLRSITCKETCITIAMISKIYGDAVEELCIGTLCQIIPLYQNSAKIIASSAYSCSLIMLKNIRSPKMLRSLIVGYDSKSSAIRGVVFTILRQVLEEWETSEAEESMDIISALLVRSFSDADQTVRAESRNIFYLIESNHSLVANDIVRQLDSKALKLIGKSKSLASSTQSINERAMSFRDLALLPMGTRAATYNIFNPSTLKAAQKNFMTPIRVKERFESARQITNSRAADQPSCILKQPHSLNKENYDSNTTNATSAQKTANMLRSYSFNTSLIRRPENEYTIPCLIDSDEEDSRLEVNVEDQSVKRDNASDISTLGFMLSKLKLDDDASLFDIDGDRTMLNQSNILVHESPRKKEQQLSSKLNEQTTNTNKRFHLNSTRSPNRKYN